MDESLYKNVKGIIGADEDNNTILAHLTNEEKNQFHTELKQLVVNQSRVGNWEKLKITYQIGVEKENVIIKGLEAL
ncbi:hypothetical protein, partial [Aliarcobacter butzleri]|uniref:hypothetical protein n=1 Tax=Aliarcobacter butzleri TaxID=28197 RepID=UPI003AF6ED47